MSLPFDATLKELVCRYPLDWRSGLGLDVELPVRALDVDLATVSAEADTVLGIGDPLSSLVHIEFQSSRDASLSRRLLMYNVGPIAAGQPGGGIAAIITGDRRAAGGRTTARRSEAAIDGRIDIDRHASGAVRIARVSGGDDDG